MSLELIWIEAHFPQLPPVLAGFVLLDCEEHCFAAKLLDDWSFLPDEEDRDVLAGMEEYILCLLQDDLEAGIRTLQEASNVIRFSTRLRISAGTYDKLTRLSEELARLLLTGCSGGMSHPSALA